MLKGNCKGDKESLVICGHGAGVGPTLQAARSLKS